jgi:cellulose synthase/poly-beta-1,6-N-acetylglucosamine synthase-like glycosyltransferase
VSIVVAAYNEEARIGRRLKELTRILRASGLRGEVIVVSDGSTDATAAIARDHCPDGVRVVALSQNMGKAAALTEGCLLASHEIIAFADARQSWAPDALTRLLENFTDPAVGAVSGDLVIEGPPGVLDGVGLYWRFEKWVRYNESTVYALVGTTGAISAVRRELFRPIPCGTILDDVHWPLQVVMQGHRVVHDRRAHAYDRLPETPADEFRRKVRTLTGNFQLLTRLPVALLPWRNPIWWQLLSHKLLRLLVPWALIGLLVTSPMLPGLLYRMAFACQAAFYLLGAIGIGANTPRRHRLAAAAGSFLVLNSAALLAFWIWVSGRAGGSWSKVSYDASQRDIAVTPPATGPVHFAKPRVSV